MSADGTKMHKMRGALLQMVPFGGAYITVQELQKNILDNWPSWGPTVLSLGRIFLDRLFETQQGDYPDLPFHLNETRTRNCWLSEKFTDTERSLLS
jgi:hypothetical protein